MKFLSILKESALPMMKFLSIIISIIIRVITEFFFPGGGFITYITPERELFQALSKPGMKLLAWNEVAGRCTLFGRANATLKVYRLRSVGSKYRSIVADNKVAVT